MNGHPQYAEDFELYQLGVLDGDDKAELDAHLSGCAPCRARLETAQWLLAVLALAAPDSEPSPAVRERVLELFRAHHSARRQGEMPARARREVRAPAWGWAWAAVCLVLLVGAAWLARDNHRLSLRLAEGEIHRKQLEASSLEMKAAAARAQAVLEVITSPQTVQVDLSPTTVHPVPHGKAFYNRAQGLVFYTTNLKSLPRNRTYELWLIPTAGKPVDAGIFSTDRQGNGQVILPSLPPGLTAKAFAVTVEPAGGVPAPTGAMVLVGPVS